MTGIEAKVNLRKALEGIMFGCQLTPKQQEALRTVNIMLNDIHGKDVLAAARKAEQ